VRLLVLRVTTRPPAPTRRARLWCLLAGEVSDLQHPGGPSSSVSSPSSLACCAEISMAGIPASKGRTSSSPRARRPRCVHWSNMSSRPRDDVQVHGTTFTPHALLAYVTRTLGRPRLTASVSSQKRRDDSARGPLDRPTWWAIFSLQHHEFAHCPLGFAGRAEATGNGQPGTAMVATIRRSTRTGCGDPRRGTHGRVLLWGKPLRTGRMASTVVGVSAVLPIHRGTAPLAARVMLGAKNATVPFLPCSCTRSNSWPHELLAA